MENGEIHGKTRWCKVLLMLLVTIFESEGKDSFVFKPVNITDKAGSTVNFTWLYQVDSSDVVYVDIGFGAKGDPIQYKYRLFTDGTFIILDSLNNSFADNVNITAIVPISLSKGGVQVLIKNVSLKDDGRFACKVRRLLIPIIDDVKLTVNVPPEIYVNNTKLTIKEGYGEVILCSATGTPVPNVTWFNNEQKVLGYGKGNASLFFKNTMRKENGTYVCIAKNSGGMKKKTSIVNVVYLDFDCSLEFEEKIAYRSVYIKGNPSPSESSCKKGKKKLALNVSKPYICLANNTFFYHTCIVSSNHKNVTIDCSNITSVRIVNATLSYYSITLNGVSRIRVPPTSDNEGQFSNYSQARKSLEKRVCKLVFKSSPSSKNVGVIVGAVLGGVGGLLVVVVVGGYAYKRHNRIN